MRIRTVLCATALATVAAFPLAGVAAAQPTDRECRDFASQAAAQSALRSHSGDPARLDADHNGIACEEHFKTAQGPGGEPRPEPRPDGERPGPGRDGDDRPAPPARPVVDRDPEPGVVVPPPGAPEDAPVRTVPEHQILVKPHGGADTGDGSAAHSGTVPGALLAGGLGVACAALVVRRRAARR